jgi:hypothetical protein
MRRNGDIRIGYVRVSAHPRLLLNDAEYRVVTQLDISTIGERVDDYEKNLINQRDQHRLVELEPRGEFHGYVSFR